MGEQVTYSLSEAIEETSAGSSLVYFPKSAFETVKNCRAGTAKERIRLFADLARFNTLYMVSRAGSGHLGSSFSSMDLMAWLHMGFMRPGDRYYSSKGHDSPGLYSLQAALSVLPFEAIHTLRRGGGLPGHPDVTTPGAWTNTGALGMGISKAKGFVFADRLQRKKGRRVIVMTGDGELQEGQVWESLVSAANLKMGEITVVVDHNKVQSDTLVSTVSDLGDLDAKFAAFGWVVRRCSGHDYDAFASILEEFDSITDRPKVLIADTVKGAGVSFMEHTAMEPGQEYYKFHSGAPSPADYRKASAEILERVTGQAKRLSLSLPAPESIQVEALVAPANAQRMIPAYTDALLALAQEHKELVALDADLILDTGLIPFKEKFPDRFVECGIAEQDMVSQAGTMALSGLLPVVHSFACFLTPRPNEQIYNAATERSKIIYVGSLAGILPGGPGHSHQAVRDIAALSGIPGLVMIEPATPRQVGQALAWCVKKAPASSYLRLTSIPCEPRPELQEAGDLVFGRGDIVRKGNDVAIIAYGPVMLAEVLKAAEQVQAAGISVRVINLPWLNVVDQDWLLSALEGARALLTVDNHYLQGGQGQFLRAQLCGMLSQGVRVSSVGVDRIPACGRNSEVLRAHELDAVGIAAAIHNLVA